VVWTVYTDNMKPVNIFAVVELSVVLVILCGNLCCAFLHPYRYIRMGYKVNWWFVTNSVVAVVAAAAVIYVLLRTARDYTSIPTASDSSLEYDAVILNI